MNRESDLDAMLARALTPPATPAALRARVMASTMRRGAREIEQLRMILQDEHGRAVQALQHRVWRQLAEAFVLAGCVFLPVRFGVHALSTWLGGFVGGSSTMPAALIPLGLVVAVLFAGWRLVGRNASGASVWSAG